MKFVLSTMIIAAAAHYGDPFAGGCESDEMKAQITGVQGAACVPPCTATGSCPTDIPAGVTAKPQCALQTSTGGKYCALICSPSTLKFMLRAGDSQCGQNASCKAISGVGICTYDGTTASEEMTFVSKFDQYIKDFGHVHTFNTPEKYAKGEKTFLDNLKRIEEHNAAGHSWTMAMNEFGHLTWEEFRTHFNLGTPMPKNAFPAGDKLHTGEGMVAPSSVDWTTKGAVTPVKNQGQCGSCWAFSTTGSLEGEFFLKNGNLQSFSEQQLVSCDDNGDQGCNGGLMDNAFGWIKENGGLCSESSYPYTAQTGTCRSGCTNVPNSAPSTHTDVAKNEQALMTAVTQQPVSIAIEADQSGFQFYSGGVFTGNCGTNLDHGVLAVGYGTESGSDYWKVKNSWGATWGDQGYIMLQRGKQQNGGQCGILLSASYPTL